MERLLSALALIAVSATCIAGTLQASWWAALAGACALLLTSLASNNAEYARLAGANDHLGQSAQLFSGALNALAAGAAAYGAGRAIGWIWGV